MESTSESEPAAPPGWRQPPPLALATILPMNRELARTALGAVALLEVRAFRTGCLLDVLVAVRQPDDRSSRLRIWQALAGVGDTEPPPVELIRFGVRFPDGSAASTVRRLPADERGGASRPAGPVLSVRSGRAAEVPGGRWVQIAVSLWLWPLPPPTEFTLTLEYPLITLPETAVALDGAAIGAAAERSSMLVDY